MLDFALVFRVFLVACSSISKAALIIASGALLAQRGVLTSDVRQGMSHMAAGLLVPCLPMLTRTPRGLRAVRAGYPWIDLPRAAPTGGAGQLAWVGPTSPSGSYKARSPGLCAPCGHHRCLLFDRVSSHVTWGVLGQAWPILPLGAVLVTIGCAFGYAASRATC